MTNEHRLALDVSLEFKIDTEVDAEAFHTFGASVMDALLDLEQSNENAGDSAVSTDSDKHHITVELLIHTDTFPDGLQLALDMTRTAFHAAGANTKKWPRVDPDLIDLIETRTTSASAKVPA